MLNTEKINSFVEFCKTTSREEILWMHGYLSSTLGLGPAGAGVANVAGAGAPAAAAGRPARFTLAYGTETGNAKSLATKLAKTAKERGFQVKLVSLDQYRLKDLPTETNFFLIISTQGDGEPPAAANPFFECLNQEGLDLSKMQFSVLGLGDSSYPMFCQTGVDADALLEKRGAKRVVPLVKCDCVFEEEGNKWLNDIGNFFQGAPAATELAGGTTAAAPKQGSYVGTVLTNVDLNDTPSNKKTHHIEIRCEEEIDYLPGDAASFVPRNPEALVDSSLELLGASGDESVTFRGANYNLRDVLLQKANLTYLPERFVKKYATLTSHAINASRMNFDDLLRAYPPKSLKVSDLVDVLEPIAPRLYSIASSPLAHPGEIHLTVARQAFCREDGQPGAGLCSTYLNGLAEDSEIEFRIHRNPAFRLPAPDADIIMIGPGTGVAPFRSFLFHRDAEGATGRNWLFFGEQCFVTDFLYQTELQDFLKTGILHRLDVAFSRDQAQKIYVQHRMAEQGAELFQWLDNGAYFYVCGAKAPMSLDVEQEILRLIGTHGKLGEQEAKTYLEKLAAEGRYLKDVY